MLSLKDKNIMVLRVFKSFPGHMYKCMLPSSAKVITYSFDGYTGRPGIYIVKFNDKRVCLLEESGGKCTYFTDVHKNKQRILDNRNHCPLQQHEIKALESLLNNKSVARQAREILNADKERKGYCEPFGDKLQKMRNRIARNPDRNPINSFFAHS